MAEMRGKQMPLGSEFSDGLKNFEAIEALKMKLVRNAQGATWRDPEKYVQGLYDAHQAITGIDNRERIRDKRAQMFIPPYIRLDGSIDMKKLMQEDGR